MKTNDMQEAMQRASVKAELLQRIQLRVWEYMDTPELKRDGIAMAMDIENMVRGDERQQLIDEVVGKIDWVLTPHGYESDDSKMEAFAAKLKDKYKQEIITLLQTIKSSKK